MCLFQYNSILWVKQVNLEHGSVLGSLMLWPLQKLGCGRNRSASSTFQAIKVSDVISREVKEKWTGVSVGEHLGV